MKPQLKQKMSDFLKDCAERIIILKIVHRRIINRWLPSLQFCWRRKEGKSILKGKKAFSFFPSCPPPLSPRFHSFLLFLGHPAYSVREVSVHRFSKILSEFALEYRTTRDRVLQQKQKRADHRERNKTRGKMIMDVNAPVSVTQTQSFTQRHTLTHTLFFSSSFFKSAATFFPSFPSTITLSLSCSLMMKRRVRYRHVSCLSACLCLCVCAWTH